MSQDKNVHLDESGSSGSSGSGDSGGSGGSGSSGGSGGTGSGGDLAGTPGSINQDTVLEPINAGTPTNNDDLIVVETSKQGTGDEMIITEQPTGHTNDTVVQDAQMLNDEHHGPGVLEIPQTTIHSEPEHQQGVHPEPSNAQDATNHDPNASWTDHASNSQGYGHENVPGHG